MPIKTLALLLISFLTIENLKVILTKERGIKNTSFIKGELRDSISYQVLIESTPEKLCTELVTFCNNKQIIYLRNLQRRLQKAIDNHPNSTYTQVSTKTILLELRKRETNIRRRRIFITLLLLGVGICLIGVMLNAIRNSQ